MKSEAEYKTEVATIHSDRKAAQSSVEASRRSTAANIESAKNRIAERIEQAKDVNVDTSFNIGPFNFGGKVKVDNHAYRSDLTSLRSVTHCTIAHMSLKFVDC